MKAVQAQHVEVLAERAAFSNWLKSVDASKIKAVVDLMRSTYESGLICGLRLSYGYALRGERLICHAPIGKSKRLNLLGWLGFDGSGVVALHEGPVKRWHFRGFICTWPIS
jgi:hypothetical protein